MSEILHYVLFCYNYYIFYFLKVIFFYFSSIVHLCGFENVIFLFIFNFSYILAYDFHELNQCDVFIYFLYFLVDQGLLWILRFKKVLVVLKKPLDLVPISCFYRSRYSIWLRQVKLLWCWLFEESGLRPSAIDSFSLYLAGKTSKEMSRDINELQKHETLKQNQKRYASPFFFHLLRNRN